MLLMMMKMMKYGRRLRKQDFVTRMKLFTIRLVTSNSLRRWTFKITAAILSSLTTLRVVCFLTHLGVNNSVIIIFWSIRVSYRIIQLSYSLSHIIFSSKLVRRSQWQVHHSHHLLSVRPMRISRWNSRSTRSAKRINSSLWRQSSQSPHFARPPRSRQPHCKASLTNTIITHLCTVSQLNRRLTWSTRSTRSFCSKEGSSFWPLTSARAAPLTWTYCQLGSIWARTKTTETWRKRRVWTSVSPRKPSAPTATPWPPQTTSSSKSSRTKWSSWSSRRYLNNNSSSSNSSRTRGARRTRERRRRGRRRGRQGRSRGCYFRRASPSTRPTMTTYTQCLYLVRVTTVQVVVGVVLLLLAKGLPLATRRILRSRTTSGAPFKRIFPTTTSTSSSTPRPRTQTSSTPSNWTSAWPVRSAVQTSSSRRTCRWRHRTSRRWRTCSSCSRRWPRSCSRPACRRSSRTSAWPRDAPASRCVSSAVSCTSRSTQIISLGRWFRRRICSRSPNAATFYSNNSYAT